MGNVRDQLPKVLNNTQHQPMEEKFVEPDFSWVPSWIRYLVVAILVSAVTFAVLYKLYLSRTMGISSHGF